VSWVEDAVSSVSDTLASIDPGPALGDAGTTIDQAVIQPAINDPVGTVVKIGAIALAPETGGASLYAIPSYTAAKAIAAGIPIEDVAKMTAISAAATAAGVSVADYVGTLAEFGTDVGSQQTAMLAAQNVGIGTGNAVSTTIGQVAGGAIGGAVGSGLAGGDIGTGLISGVANAGIGAGVGAAVDAGGGLLSGTNTGSTNTGTTNMDETIGPTYAELGYSPNMGPTNQELGYDPYANLNAGDVEAQQGGYYGGPGYGYQPDNPYTNMTDAQIAAEIAKTPSFISSGLDTSTIGNLLKQYGTQAVKALLGSGVSSAVSAAQRAALKAQGYTDAQINGMAGTGGSLLGAGANYLLSNQARQQIQSAAQQSYNQQMAATQQAQQQASFKPVGITTAFGQSNFQFDPTTGQMTSAGYTPTSQVAGQVQNLFGLGASALPTTANTQDIQNQYVAQQQGLLASGREQQLAGINNQQWQTGRTGLATGGTMAGYAPGQPGLMQTNPELAAYYNSIGQQNAQIASNAPTYAQNLLNSQIATGTNLFGAANTLEGYAQAPLTLSAGLGTAASGAGAKAGYYGLLGNQSAAQTQLQGNVAAASGQLGAGQGLLTAANPLLASAGNVISQWF
jgi:hypothetical protein